MASQTNYPTSIDTIATDVASGSQIGSANWNTYADAIVAVETKVGVTGGASGSIDYTVNNAAGLLQTHKTRHQDGGADVISIASLTGTLAEAQKVSVKVSGGAIVSTRSILDFVSTGTVTITAWDDGSNAVIQVSKTGGGSANLFTSSGSWTIPSGVTRCTVLLWGAGGAGGRSAAGAGGGGGGGGSFAIGEFATASLSTPYVTIGSGGPAVGVDNTDGAAGGTSIFTSSIFEILTAPGGGGGAAVGSSTAGGGGGGGGTLGTGVNATTNAHADGGRPGGGAATSTDSQGLGGGAGGDSGAGGGNSMYGGAGGGGGHTTTNAAAGGTSYYGGGGGGGANDTSAGAAGGGSYMGGAGGAGGGNGATGTAGSQPGGGGGGGEGTNSGAGGSGMCIILSY